MACSEPILSPSSEGLFHIVQLVDFCSDHFEWGIVILFITMFGAMNSFLYICSVFERVNMFVMAHEKSNRCFFIVTSSQTVYGTDNLFTASGDRSGDACSSSRGGSWGSVNRTGVRLWPKGCSAITDAAFG